jgi:NOL1/NOP2/fmu family ribosome biogenesis protein
MFRKYENAPSEWSANAPAFCAERQREILHYAAQTVAPGGYLLYATCTFSVEENEGTVEWFLEEFPGFTLLELPERLQKVSSPGVNMPFARRFYPHKAAGEGQFVALLQRDVEGVRRDTPAFTDGREHIPFEELRVLEEFLEGTLEKCGDLNLCKYGKYLFSATMPAAKENTFSPGVTLGTVEKRRFVPHHQLFKCFGSRFLRKLELTSDDKRVMQYLSGAEIDCDLEDGWAVVTLHGLPLGGIKVSCGRGKNHYPKGLRVNGL